MKSLVTSIALFIGLSGLAQNDTLPPPVSPAPVDTTIYTFVEVMPHFPGGEVEFQKYLHDNVHYPQAEKDSAIGEYVYVSFVVETDGRITNVRTVRGVKNAPALSVEAERVIRESSPWVPGSHNGRHVRVSITLPICFLPG